LGLAVASAGCGPDKRPQQFCDGPSFNLVVTAEGGALPPDIRLNVHYGSNQEGEPYTLGQKTSGQSVFCEELRAAGDGAGGDGAESPSAESAVGALSCRLFTQGPAQLDVTATGYETIRGFPLSLAKDDRCQVEYEVELARQLADAGT
jgi:hypothetical protein